MAKSNWDQWREASREAKALLDVLRAKPAEDLTADDHRRVDEVLAKASALRAAVDKDRAVLGLESVTAGHPGVPPGSVSAEDWGSLVPVVDPDAPGMPAGRDLVAAALSGKPEGKAAEFLQEMAVRAGHPDTPGAFIGSQGLRFPWLAKVEGSLSTGFGYGVGTQPMVSPVFPPVADLAMMGITQTGIAMNQARAIWLRKPSAASRAEGGPVVITDLPSDSVSLNPRSVSAGSRVSVELAALMPGAGGEILSALMMAVAEEMANQIWNGDTDTNAQEFNGLREAITAPTAATSETTFQQYAALFPALVEGTFARTVSDIRVVVPQGVYSHMAGRFVSAGSGEMSALDKVRSMLGGGPVVSPRLPAVDATAGHSVDVWCRRGVSSDAAFWPVWNSVEVGSLVDQRAASLGSGRLLIAHGLHSFAVAPTTSGRLDFARLSVDTTS